MSDAGRIKELTIGHAVNAAMIYGFDYVLYPFVVWKLGLISGGITMSILSLVSCLLTLWFYDWSKTDWLGIEAIKELRDGECKTRIRRFISWTLSKGDIPACLALSIYSDPFITTACLRRGAFQGMCRRDWHIFFSSWVIANGFWVFTCFGGIALVKQIWAFASHTIFR